MAPEWIFELFPKLKLADDDPVSPQDTKYNCIAFAAGDVKNNWDDGRYWPPGVPRDWSIAGLSRAFATLGYEPCGQDGSLEPNFEKVVFYVEPDGTPTHASWQRGDGRWKSKIGSGEDIIHATPECLESDCYGKPAAYVKRKRESDI